MCLFCSFRWAPRGFERELFLQSPYKTGIIEFLCLSPIPVFLDFDSGALPRVGRVALV
jgi:hypothetical protein